MSESSPTPSSDGTKSFLDVSIIAALTVAANHFLPAAQHSEATTVIPFIGGGVACGATWPTSSW